MNPPKVERQAGQRLPAQAAPARLPLAQAELSTRVEVGVEAGFETRFEAWFEHRGWAPFAFQREVWREILAGHSGMLHATTGAGKTYAVWLGALAAFASPTREANATSVTSPETTAARASAKAASAAPLTVLWITPMRALATDTVRALEAATQALEVDWSIGLRTGDTSSAERARQQRRLPSALVTTPESLTLLLSRPDAKHQLASVRLVVVDEWHELIGNKRGVQTQLALARLARWAGSAHSARSNTPLQVWGLSATLGNLDAAQHVLLAPIVTPHVMVRGHEPKVLQIDALIPESIERFPWGGHLGLRQIEPVAAELDAASTSLVFTNTRSQAEIWYRSLLAARPEWAGIIALHHGSLDRSVREWVELGLKEGRLKVVVCTSSLDLGVDFLPVDRVFQIGSPKGVARLLQRAGRSGHAPGRASRITIVPTHALELVEAAAARCAVLARQIEARVAPREPYDVLIQHLVTIALGGGFKPDELYDEIRSTDAYRELSRATFDWAIAFAERGGRSLGAYPDYQRIAADAQGIYRVPRDDLARRHRMNVGTITASASMHVEFVSGGRIGTIEETFISRLRKGDVFTFSGRQLELVRVKDMTAYVKRASAGRGLVPAWQGGRMPLSSELAHATLALLARAAHGDFSEPEMHAVRPLLEIQARWSALPEPELLLVETLASREGHHLFCYPFAGRMAHVGIGSLLAWRAARNAPGTFSISMNDYGFELLSADPIEWGALIEQDLFASDNLAEDLLASLNSSELAKRRFRDIAQISGLVFQGHPGSHKSTRQIQASSSLFYQVFRDHDSENLLLAQAETEVMLQELEVGRIAAALAEMQRSRVALHVLERPSPFAFPLIIERLRERISTAKLSDRVARMLAELERAADLQSRPTKRPKARQTARPTTRQTDRKIAQPTARKTKGARQ